jgi:hypothetical protein
MICGRSPRLAMRAPQAATTISRHKLSSCSSTTLFCKSDPDSDGTPAAAHETRLGGRSPLDLAR